MKTNFLLLSVLAVASMGFKVYGAETVLSLDLSNPVVPAQIEWAEDAFLASTDGAYWSGTYSDEVNWLQFGDFLISHTLGGSWGGTYWDGFTVAKGSDTGDHSATDDGGWMKHQWFNIAGGGVNAKTDPYLVGFWGYYVGAPEQTNQIKLVDDQLFKAGGLFVTSHTWPYYSNMNGCAPARAFKQGDYMKLVAHAVTISGAERTAEMMLANYDGQLQQLEEWTWWDLTSLNDGDECDIASLYFTVESTDMGDWGMNTPAYFCVDKVEVSVQDPSTAVDDLNVETQVASVTYVNVAGQQSVNPFDGVNVVVTRYTDGHVSTTKVVK